MSPDRASGRASAVLALDTSGEPVSVALRHPAGIVTLEAAMGVRAGEALHALIASVLERAALTPAELDLIAAVRGPGSFTGLRVGLAAAGGLALAAGVPACGVSTSAALAWSARTSGEITVVLPAGPGRAFIAVHRRTAAGLETLHEARDVAMAELAGSVRGRLVLRGRGWWEPGATTGGGDHDAHDPGMHEVHDPGTHVVHDAPLAPAAAELAALGWREPLEPLYAREAAIRPSRSAP